MASSSGCRSGLHLPLDYMNVKEKFTLAWQNRGKFGTFDTQYSVADGDGIVEWIVDAFKREQLARKAGRAEIPGNSWYALPRWATSNATMAQRELDAPWNYRTKVKPPKG